MRRREVLGLTGGALLCARAAAAQQPERALPVVGFLRNTAADDSTHLVQAFRNGLSDAGYVEGRNVRIAYRWTGGQAERLPALAAELAALKVSVIVTLGNTQAVRAAKAATASIPIVFMLGTDPVELGFVASLARPGGNLTGVFNLNQQLAQKWLEVLHEIVPAATTFALLVNPTNPATTMRYTEAMQAAAQTLGLGIHVVQASADRDFDAAFANVREHRAGALAIAADALFISRVDQLAALTCITPCRRSIRFASSPRRAASRATEPISPTPIARPGFTPAVFSMARSRPICRCSRPPRSSSSST